MIPRKKRIAIIIVLIIIIILITLSVFLALYFNTDLFKSNQYLFSKYIGKNIDNVKAISKSFEKSEYDKLLEENKYISSTQIKVNCTEEIGTSLENTQNDINKFKMTINEQSDKKSQYNYENIQLLKDNEKVLGIEYIQDTNVYGIRFSDLFKQYILVENTNLKELFAKIGYGEQEVESIPDQIQFNNNLKSTFEFTEDEERNMKERYSSIFNSETFKNKISKQSNIEINIGEKTINTNTYTLTLTIEQLNDIYIKMLEMLKQDEVILSKLDSLQSELEKYKSISNIEITNIKESFVSNIDETIDEINKNNIGNEETKIIVYENNGNTLRTSIQAVEYEINFDCLQEQNYMQLDIKDKTQQKYSVFELSNNNNELNIDIEDVNEDEIRNISIVKSEKTDGSKCEKNITAKLEEDNNKIEANINTNIELVNDFESEIELSEENSIKLNNLEKDNLKKIINAIKTSVSEEVNKIVENIKKEDISKITEILGIAERQEIQVNGISETEKNRFNSKFEMFRGEKIQSANILNLIEESKNNLIGMEVISNNILKLELSMNEKNEEIEKTLTTFIEKNNNMTYNVDIEYDENNNLAKYIVLTIVKK